MKVQDKGYFLQVLKINRFLNGNEEDIETITSVDVYVIQLRLTRIPPQFSSECVLSSVL